MQHCGAPLIGFWVHPRIIDNCRACDDGMTRSVDSKRNAVRAQPANLTGFVAPSSEKRQLFGRKKHSYATAIADAIRALH
jgi:hypothetical protein